MQPVSRISAHSTDKVVRRLLPEPGTRVLRQNRFFGGSAALVGCVGRLLSFVTLLKNFLMLLGGITSVELALTWICIHFWA